MLSCVSQRSPQHWELHKKNILTKLWGVRDTSYEESTALEEKQMHIETLEKA